MKIAVCLFGHLRTYKYCCEALNKNLLNLYDCDVFMHTWSTVESTTVTWHNDKMKENTSTLELKDKIVDMYNLTDIVIEEQQDKSDEFGFAYYDLWYHDGLNKTSIWGINCLNHSIIESYKLAVKYSKNNNVKYDYIVFIRPDLLLYSEFTIEKFVLDLNKEEVENSFFFTSLIQQKTRINDIRMMCTNDLIFFGTPKVIASVMKTSDTFLSKLHDGLILKNRVIENIRLELIENLGYTNYCIDYHMFKDFIILRENNIPQNSTPQNNCVPQSKFRKLVAFLDNCTGKIINSQFSNFLILLLILLLSLSKLDVIDNNSFCKISVFSLIGIAILSFTYAYKLARKLLKLIKKFIKKLFKHKN